MVYTLVRDAFTNYEHLSLRSYRPTPFLETGQLMPSAYSVKNDELQTSPADLKAMIVN